MKRKEKRPEEECGQEVHEVVCYQPRDVQQEAHILFDSEAENFNFRHDKGTNEQLI